MSVVVARDPSTVGDLVCAWPSPIPWSAEAVCESDDVIIVCTDWNVVDQLGPGRHALQPPNPQSHIAAYFVKTTPASASFEHMVSVFDRATGMPSSIHYSGSVTVRVGDPLLLCSQLIGVPTTDLAAGILRSASSSVVKALEVMIHKLLYANTAVASLASPSLVSQLVHMTASGNPMAIAVNGIDFLKFERISVSVNGGTAVHITDEDALASAASDSGHNIELTSDEPFASGVSVLVYGDDGLWHAGTVQGFRDGGYEVVVGGADASTWVEASRVRSS
ncbi:MAG: hypothetical protein Tsb0020_01850 [Haliangiales bacterium]